MKTKSLFLAAMFMLVLLISGGQHATVTALDNNSNTTSRPDLGVETFTDEESDFNLEIDYVGVDIVTPLSLEADGTYHVVASGFKTITVNISLSGWTCWGCDISDDGDNLNDVINPYNGQLYQIVNGKISRSGTTVLGNGGTAVNVVSGDNNVGFLYVARDENGDLHWASDSIIVRVRSDSADFDTDNIVTRDVTFNFDLNETAGLSDMSPFAPIAGNAGGVYYAVDYVYRPSGSISGVYAAGNGTVLGNVAQNNAKFVGVEDGDVFNLTGDINTTGFQGPQGVGIDLYLAYLQSLVPTYLPGPYDYINETLIEATRTYNAGHYFYYDAAGIHLLDSDTAAATIMTTTNAGGVDQTINNHVGIIALADYGYWDLTQDAFGTIGHDWEGIGSGYLLGDPNGYDNIINSTIQWVNTTDGDGTPLYNIVNVTDGAYTYVNTTFFNAYNGSLFNLTTFPAVSDTVGEVDYEAFWEDATLKENVTETMMVYNNQQIPYFGSTDFVANAFDYNLQTYQRGVVLTNTNTITDLNTSSVASTRTTTSTEDAPGFTGAASLIAVGTVAWLIPRIRKKN